MSEFCPECGHLIRHHYVNDESFDQLSLTCPARYDAIFKRGGRPTGQPCPECKSEVVYNGNYFCSKCPWALDEDEDHTPYMNGMYMKELI